MVEDSHSAVAVAPANFRGKFRVSPRLYWIMPTQTPTAAVPKFWETACQALCQADPVLAKIIERHAGARLVPRGDPFSTLARAIVGQQISVKAAASVWDRIQSEIGPIKPKKIARLRSSAFSGLGLSARKIEYLMDLAFHFDREPDLADQLALADDEAIIERLTQIRGIGRWTAEMALIFAFMRPNVLPVADLGLMKAISLHYRKGSPIDAKTAQRIAQPWQPWRSVATWYLWRSLDPEPVEY